MFNPHRSPRSLLVRRLRLLVLVVLLLGLPLTSQLPIAAATVPATVRSGPDTLLDQPEHFIPVAQQGDDASLVSTTTPVTPTATLEEPAPEAAENQVYLPLVQGQPGEDTNASVDPELTAAIEQALSNEPDAPSATTILVSNVKQSGDWAFGNVAIPAAEDNSGPRAFLFLAKSSDTTWNVTFEAEATFQAWLPLIPETLMSEEERAILTIDPTLTGDGSGQLSLPWATGETWYLTGGPHIAVDGSVRNALDFAGGSGEVRAARDGIAYYTASCPNYISIVHDGGWKTTYYHVTNIAVGYGQSVSRGQFLGRISAQAGCGGWADGAHVHFATYLNNIDKAMHGLDIGGWTVENGAAAYTGCMVRIRDGSRQCSSQGQIYNDGSIGSGAPPNQPPNKPALVAPAAGSRVAGSSVKLEWKDNGDPDNQPRTYRDYAVEIYRDGVKVKESGWITGTSWTISTLSAGTYEWRIQSGDGDAASGWAGPWQFILGNAPLEVVCDNLSACFSKYESSGAWGYVQPGTGDSSSAYNQHAYWTYNGQNSALDWGKWQPNLPQTGTYEVYVWYPHYPGIAPETGSAHYQIHHSAGDQYLTWNQATNYGRWNKLTTVSCPAGTACYVKLTDETHESTGTRRVWFDAVKFVLVANPQITLSPLQLTRGMRMDEHGTGFTPNGQLHMSIRLPNGTYYEQDLQADANGNFSYPYTMPTDAQIGHYAYRMQDVASGSWSNTVEYDVLALNPQITLSPLQLTRGMRMDEHGTGFTPNGPLHMSIRLPNGTYYEQDLQADATGNFSYPYTMPTNAQIGHYAYRMQDVTSGLWSNTVEYDVLALNPRVSVTPGTGTRGTTFQQPGTGFTPNGQVRLEFRYPDGTIQTKTVTADANGTYTNPYTMPANALIGQYRYNALDIASNTWSNTVFFNVEAAATYTVSGRVTTSSGTGLAGVTISDGTRSATTDTNGNYTLSNVPAGTYTLTPAKSGYSFSPTSRSVAVSGNVSGQNFTATALTYSVSGRVTTSSGTGLAGVTISDGTRSATTDTNGNYTLSNVPAGTYTLTPAKSGYSFSPTSRSVTVSGNVSGQNFTATALTYSVSGRITTSSGTGLAGVTLADGTRSATTDTNGNYTLSNIPAGTYTLTPAKSGYSFSPTSRSVTVSGNVSGQNFTATALTYSISGQVRDSSNNGVSGVTISAGGKSTTTGSTGSYTLSGLGAGSYTVSATKTNCTFSPSSRSVSVPPNATGQNFTATCTVPDTTPPGGRITAPAAGQTLGPSTITFSADAWDNSGGSGIDRVEFKVYYDGSWHSAGIDTTAAYAVFWTTPSGLTSQQLQFAIWVYDRAGNYVVDPGGKVAVNFVAPTSASISGTVTDASGNGVSGVTISTGSTSTTTTSNGSYTINGLTAGSYTIRASKTNCTFTPPSLSVSVPPSRSNQNFTATCTLPTYTISGRITDESGNSLAGVTISDGTRNATTDTNGTYTLSNVPAGTYTLTPAKSGYNFTPATRNVTISGNVSEQNFTATPLTYSVSGRVVDGNGTGLAGVTLSDGTRSATTDTNGTYTLNNVPAGTYTLTPVKNGYTFTPATHSLTVSGNVSEQNFTATPLTYSVSGRVVDGNGTGLAGVTLSDGTRSATTDTNGNYTLSNVPAGTYTLTPAQDGYTFIPTTRSVAVASDVTDQDFTAVAPSARSFQVDRDGLSFRNFRYYGADWEHFKKTFPGTQMELPTGERRKGPERYFKSALYENVGEGGNCAGFTAVSLIRFLELPETVELELLTPANRAINPPWNWSDFLSSPYGPRKVTVNQSDLADYIHLYQARQQSQAYIRWWNGTTQWVNGEKQQHDRHFGDTSLQTYQAIKSSTQSGIPLAVSIKQDKQGHRMTAYRTTESGNRGYIYVYDNNWPGDTNRSIEVNLTTGQWSYALDSRTTWSGTTTGLFYTPASLNFPAQLWLDYDYDAQTRLASGEENQGTIVGIDGTATLLITDDQGRQMGYKDGNLVSDIPGAIPMYNFGYDPEHPDADNIVGFYLPATTPFSVTIQPITDAGTYTLTAFGGSSALHLDDISISAGTVDTLVLEASVQQTRFIPATDDDYCHYLTREFTTASRDFTSCVTANTGETVQFALDATGNDLLVANQGSSAVALTSTINQIGTDAQTVTVNETIAPGTSVTVSTATHHAVYLPLITK